MEVDHYNLTVEQLIDGCQDPRVQHFSQTNRSEYCTWRVIHTLGKSGTKPGIVALKADRLNHMDPPAGTCTKHSHHYTCACTGEYCNRGLPPCAWIRKVDPDATKFTGCTEDYAGNMNTLRCNFYLKTVYYNLHFELGCVFCDLLQSERRYKITMDKAVGGCMDTRLHDTSTIQIALYCMWTITSMTIKTYKWSEGLVFRLGTRLADHNPKAGNCKVRDGNFQCSCNGHLCNMVPPRCSALRKAMSSRLNPKGCFEDQRKGKGRSRNLNVNFV